MGATEGRGKVASALRKIGNLRPRISHSTLLTGVVVSLILAIAYIVRMLPIRWGMDLSEFDPFAFYRYANHLVQLGFVSWFTNPNAWVNWTVISSWYPYGIDVGRTYFPMLAMAGAFFYEIASLLGIGISLKNLLILLPPIFGAITCLVAYFLGKDIAGRPVGILSALFLALNPSYIGRTTLGFFDNESIGVTAILLIILFFLRSMDMERPRKYALFYMIAAGLTVGYLCAQWGGGLYPVDMIALFALIALFMKRYSRRLLLSYSVTFGLGLFIAVTAPKPGLNFLTTSTVLPIAGVFILLLLSEVLRDVKKLSMKATYTAIFFALLIGGFVAISALGLLHSPAGKIPSLLQPFLRITSPIIESVQENHVTAWGSIYYDYGVGILFILFGFFLAVRNLTNRNLFLMIYALTGLYFAMSMVRLTVVLAPAFCILWAIGVMGIINPFLNVLKQAPRAISSAKKQLSRVGREFSAVVVLMIFVLLTLTLAFPSPRAFTSAYTPVTILSDTTGIGPSTGALTEWVDACTWMNPASHNIPPNQVFVCWWDYGYYITIEGNQTTVIDNATENTTQIALVGAIYMSNLTQSIKMLKDDFNGPYGPPRYIVVFSTWEYSSSSSSYQQAGYGDEGKWRWFAEISGNDTLLSNGTPANGNSNLFGNYSIGEDATSTGAAVTNSSAALAGQSTTFYKLLYYSENYLLVDSGSASEAAAAINLEGYFTLASIFPFTATSYDGLYPIVAVFNINYGA
ncbi:MAG TPA: STT3 domain-containing protein [Candidatus Bathyarchaeia archaeon]|nr:STT3 domain-containing protein [Candidatus Bathyarchaeia archaeon]